MKDDKKSIMKEALTDYKEIMEAADANAKKKLADEFPEKFNSLLKEELNKNKSDKKSYKKLDESEKNKEESDMKNQEKETEKTVVKEKAGEGKPFEKKAEKVEKVEEDVKITDTVGDGDPFKEKAKKAAKVDETAGEGKPFQEKPKGKKEEKSLQTEEFDVTGQDIDSVGSAIESADDEDELLTMEEIEQEIANMENLDERITDITEPASPSYMDKGNKGIAFDQLVQMRNQIDEMLNSVGEQKEQGGEQNFAARDAMGKDGGHAGATTELIDEHHLEDKESKIAFVADALKNMDDAAIDKIYRSVEGEMGIAEMHQGNFPLDKMHQGEYDDKLIDEEGPITMADVEAVLGASGQEVDENLGITHANNKKVTATLPRFENKPESHKQHTRSAVQSAGGMVTGIQGESQKKINGLIEENKKLTKKLNEVKKYKESVSGLVESYKSALDKYRNQLKEMAIFNTNLAHVNNLLVNEELALTQDDKIKIINEFKKIDNITESQEKYKSLLSEMKEGKTTLTESVERKAAASVQPSSKQKLDEVVEKTAYADDKHIQKMRKLIEYVEHRGKKNNL